MTTVLTLGSQNLFLRKKRNYWQNSKKSNLKFFKLFIVLLLNFFMSFFRFLEKGGDPNKTVTAEMVAHQYDDKGRSTRASGSEDPQSTDNTPQPLPKKTRYSLRSVKSKEIPQAHSGASGLARQISEPSTSNEIPRAHAEASGYARQISGPSTSKEIPQAHSGASGFARQISEHEDDDNMMGNNMDQMDVDRMDEIDEDRPPNIVHPYAKYTVNHIFSNSSINFFKNPLIEDLIMENLVTSVEVMQS
jgi:hypothetical protein